jgi:hypothetical protein
MAAVEHVKGSPAVAGRRPGRPVRRGPWSRDLDRMPDSAALQLGRSSSAACDDLSGGPETHYESPWRGLRAAGGHTGCLGQHYARSCRISGSIGRAIGARAGSL